MSRLLQDWLREQATLRPESTALVMRGDSVTYGALEDTANRIAFLLREAGCRPGDRICLMLPKSTTAIAAIHGALKAGCIYVPIDTASPAARVARIFDACEPAAVLAGGTAAGLLDETCTLSPAARGAAVGLIEGTAQREGPTAFTGSDLLAAPADRIDIRVGIGEPAHILFTSGSTGTPKGVVVRHSSVITFVDWARGRFGIGPDDRVSGHPPLHFDLSTFDIFGTMSAGAELHLVPPELNILPNKIADLIRSSRLTQWFSVPSVLNFMAKLDVVRQGDFPDLKRLLWCGEAFPTPPLIYWMQRLPHVRFTNLYGPTEAAIASSHYTMPAIPQDDRAEVPIGEACGGERLLVLDEDLRPVPQETVADLYIAGAGLSPGYWRDPDKTAEVFLTDPATGERIYRTGDLSRRGSDGLYYFHGRSDSQVKIRGYRIELGEIETALNSLGSLQECAVVAPATDTPDGGTICCAYTQRKEVEASPADLRKALGRLVPSYMIPTRWARLEMLPKNANGKIDRRRLREDFSDDRI